MGDVDHYRTTEEIVEREFHTQGYPEVVEFTRDELRDLLWDAKLNEKRWMIEHYHRTEGKDNG